MRSVRPKWLAIDDAVVAIANSSSRMTSVDVYRHPVRETIDGSSRVERETLVMVVAQTKKTPRDPKVHVVKRVVEKEQPPSRFDANNEREVQRSSWSLSSSSRQTWQLRHFHVASVRFPFVPVRAG